MTMPDHTHDRSVTVAHLLQMEAMNECKVVGGHDGMKRLVRWIHCSDLPDASFWLRGGELLVHSGDQSRGTNIVHLLRQLNDVGAAGLVVAEASDMVTPEAARTADEVGIPLIVVPDQVRFVDLTYAVGKALLDEEASAAMDIQNFWLISAPLAIKDFQQALQQTADWLNARVWLFDKFGMVLSSTTPTQGTSSLGSFRFAKLTNDVLAQAVRHPDGLRTSIQNHFAWIAPIWVRSSLYGFVVIADDPFSNRVNSVRVDHALRLVQFAAVISSEAKDLRLHLYVEFFEALLDEREGNTAALQRRARDIGFPLDRSGSVAILSAGQARQGVTFDRVESIAADYLHRGVVVLTRADHVVVWVPGLTWQDEQHDRDVIHHLTRSLEHATGLKEWRSGMGQRQSGIPGIRLSYAQAECAVGRAQPGEIVGFGDLTTWDVLWHHIESAVPTEFVNTYVSKLSKREHARLVETIDALVEENFNFSAAAKRLSLHRNGLTRRVEKWVETIGVDVTNSRHALALWAMLKAQHQPDA